MNLKLIYSKFQIICKSKNNYVFRSFSQNTQTIVTEVIAKTLLIGINRPEKKNCIDESTACQLIKAFKDFENDDNLYIAVLYGKGGTFCSGYDLSELSKLDSNNIDLNELSLNGRGPMGPSRRFIKKPVIAAISGFAVAGGLELALMCDLRVVEEAAVMGVFCRKHGVPLIDGGTVRLPKLIGLSRAMDLILTGRPVLAKEAFDIGLANRIVANGTAIGEAVKLAQSLSKHPQECLNADRLSSYNAMLGPLPQNGELRSLNFEWSNGIKVIHTESVRGAKQFLKDNKDK